MKPYGWKPRGNTFCADDIHMEIVASKACAYRAHEEAIAEGLAEPRDLCAGCGEKPCECADDELGAVFVNGRGERSVFTGEVMELLSVVLQRAAES